MLLAINGLDFGGTETALAQLARTLRRRDRALEVLSLKRLGRLGMALREEGIDVDSLEMDEAVGARSLLNGAWRLSRRLRRDPPTVIYSCLPRANVLTRLANRMAGRPAIHLTGERSTDYQRAGSVVSLNRWTERYTDHTVAVSTAVAQALRDRGELCDDRCTVIGNGIDLRAVDQEPAVDIRSELELPTSTRLLVAAGRLIPDKGYRYLIEAFSRLDRSDAHLLVAGEGPERGRLEVAIRELGVHGRVHLPGFRQDVVGILKSADAFVLSSLEEGVPMVVVEAMACGLPVVSTAVGGVPDLLGQGAAGLLVAPAERWASGERRSDDPAQVERGVAELTSALSVVLGDSDCSRQLGRAARQRAEQQLDMERVVDSLEALCAALAEARAQGNRRPAFVPPSAR
jgi:glycosyltransferase involved in cell wall biosynthesis